MKKEAEELITIIYETAERAPQDLCGEHREFYNPRLAKALVLVSKLHPDSVVEALSKGVI